MTVCPLAWAVCSLAWTSSFTAKYLLTHLQDRAAGQPSEQRNSSARSRAKRDEAADLPVDADALALVKLSLGVPLTDALRMAALDDPPKQVRHGLELHRRLAQARLVKLPGGRSARGSTAEEGRHE